MAAADEELEDKLKAEARRRALRDLRRQQRIEQRRMRELADDFYDVFFPEEE